MLKVSRFHSLAAPSIRANRGRILHLSFIILRQGSLQPVKSISLVDCAAAALFYVAGGPCGWVVWGSRKKNLGNNKNISLQLLEGIND